MSNAGDIRLTIMRMSAGRHSQSCELIGTITMVTCIQVGNAAGDIRMIVNGYRAGELENDALPGTLVTIVHSVCVCV